MHLLSPILWPRLDLKWLCSSRTLSCLSAPQPSAPSANAEALIINPLKGPVRPQCSYYQMTRHYFPPPSRRHSRRRRLLLAGPQEQTSNLSKRDQSGNMSRAGRGWGVSGGIRHDSVMTVVEEINEAHLSAAPEILCTAAKKRVNRTAKKGHAALTWHPRWNVNS